MNPRHNKRGGVRGVNNKTRKPYQNRFSVLLETHLDVDNDDVDDKSTPIESIDEEKKKDTKPTLISDRPETEVYDKNSYQKDFQYTQSHSGFNRNNKRGYNNDGKYSETRSYRGDSNRGASRGRYREQAGRYKDRGGYKDRGAPRGRYREQAGRYKDRGGYKRGGYNNGGRGGYNNGGRDGQKYETQTYDQRSNISDKYDVESTHSQKDRKRNY